VKRHPALVPLSHQHHTALVAARRLRRGADGAEPETEAAAFLAFFAEEAVPHFRDEEEMLFPQVANRAEAQELILEALLQHQRLHALAAEMTEQLANGKVQRDNMRTLAEFLESHTRLEERKLFPLIEQLVPEERLHRLALRATEPEACRGQASGPVWGIASEELNATLLSWNAGEGPPEHVNEERDVLLVVLAGAIALHTDDDARELGVGETTIIAKGRPRKITALRDGTRYLSVHRRRPSLAITLGATVS
jgi:quercetin dioxygenase-like cupin family protein/iron-sulfur cluster repair protein YtfE (RIC family)